MQEKPSKGLPAGSLSFVIDGLLDLLYPLTCKCCGKELCTSKSGKKFICDDCLDQVEYIRSPICLRCGRPLEPAAGIEDRYCGWCLEQPPHFHSARSAAVYRPPLSTLLHRLKYQADTTVRKALAELLEAGADNRATTDADVLVPVPLHRKRLTRRGLNQSLEIARIAFPHLRKKIVPNLLIRSKNTKPQTELNGIARRRNLRGAFRVSDEKMVKDKKIILIDDVFTTGTTIAECSKTLKKAGASEIYAWTVARV